MKIVFKNHKTCGKIRYIGLCPKCKENLVLDDEVFARDERTIYCYQCGHKFMVISVVKNKTTLNVEVIVDETK